MAWTIEEIKDRVKSPKKSKTLNKIIRHENRIRFHAESFMDVTEINQPASTFLDWVKSLIPKDKFIVFASLFQFPLLSVELTDKIFRELEKVFEGKNPVFNYQFVDSTYRDDWEWYRQDQLKEPLTWRKDGWDAVKTAINSVLIVDLPTQQTSALPEPYFYFLDIRSVIDYDYNEQEDKILSIVFKQPDNKIACFDDVSYRMFEITDKGEIGALISESFHDLGFCPARFFWSTELTTKEPERKKSPISHQLSNLDWSLFFAISKRHLDLYAPYPIYSAYAADCDYRNNQTGDYCDGGYLRNADNNYLINRTGGLEPCPACSSKRLTGVGSFIEIPIPQNGDPDLKDPVKITSIDRDSLDYNVEESQRIDKKIYDAVVGTGGEGPQKQSLNELQVISGYENRKSVLNSLKRNLESAIKWVDDTLCKLRYGNAYLGSSISMGDEFYIYTIEDLHAMYKQAKENGSSEASLDAIQDQILQTTYRNNPNELQRMIILKHLEPYRHFTLEELLKLQEKQLLNLDLLKIKINFSTFVDRFERENINILEFASAKTLAEKVKIIQGEFRKYLKEESMEPSPVLPPNPIERNEIDDDLLTS